MVKSTPEMTLDLFLVIKSLEEYRFSKKSKSGYGNLEQSYEQEYISEVFAYLQDPKIFFIRYIWLLK